MTDSDKSPNLNQDFMVMLARVDERTQAMLIEMRTIKETTITKAEFSPVKSLVYGLVAVVMSSVVLALVTLVLQGR